MKTKSARSAWSWLREYWLNLRRIRFWIVVVAIVYTFAGFLVLPWVATGIAVNTVADDLGRDLRIGPLRTNPFTLTLEVKDLALDDVDGQELLLLPGLDLAGTLDVDGLALALAEPLAQRFAHVRVDSDSLSAQGKLRSGPVDPLTYQIVGQPRQRRPRRTREGGLRSGFRRGLATATATPDQLRAALIKRPELALELPAPYAPDTDRPALQRQLARAAMVERLGQAGIDVANPSLKAPETGETLEAMFADLYPQRALADVRERFTTAEEDEAQEFDAAAYREHLATKVTAAQTVTEEDLEALSPGFLWQPCK